jgi:hypothetical protein
MSDHENLSEDPSLDLLNALAAFTKEELIETDEIVTGEERERLLKVGSTLFIKLRAATKDCVWYDAMIEFYSTYHVIGNRICSPHANGVQYWGIKSRVSIGSEWTYDDMLQRGKEYIRENLFNYNPSYRFRRLANLSEFTMTFGSNTSVMH